MLDWEAKLCYNDGAETGRSTFGSPFREQTVGASLWASEAKSSPSMRKERPFFAVSRIRPQGGTEDLSV